LDGIQRLHQQVDSIITVANQKLMHNSKCTYLDAYQVVNDILYQGVQGVTDLIVRPGLINLDFADVHTIVSGAGRALIGTGTAYDDR
jgi:cell division protein FtsZ